MLKKSLCVSLVCLISFGAAGCHSHHRESDEQASITTENEKNETQVTVDQLPPAVVKTVNKKVPDGTIVSAETMIWERKMIYEIDVKSGDTVYELRIHEDGKFISKGIDND